MRHKSTPEMVIERIQSRVRKQGECWIWTGSVHPFGYGAMKWGGIYGAHRVSYTVHKGVIPEGLCVCHTCDNPACVNPEHLFIGSHKDNAHDRDGKSRFKKRIGTQQPMAKLNDEMAAFIKKNFKPYHPEFGATALAKRFNVSRESVTAVTMGHTWTHVKI